MTMEQTCYQIMAEVIKRDALNRFHRVHLLAPEIARNVQPGQFVCIFLDDGDSLKLGTSLGVRFIMPRPFSVSDVEGDEIEIAFSVVGAGTAAMAQLKVGDSVRLLGPLGKPFSWCDGHDVALLVGGGMGYAPLPFLSKVLVRMGVDVVAIVGAKSFDELPVRVTNRCVLEVGDVHLAADEFAKHGVPSAIALEQPHADAFCGTAVDLTLSWLKANEHRKVAVYACGPKEMLKCLQRILIERAIYGQFSIEERMACGLGLCFGCACKVVECGKECYKLACVDGPVFDAHMLAL
ncbi:MAG: hypothetical protein RMK18_02030 [Armatimonadota bacterium]|nr:hypothetical protein [Armatimonadota bacterium]MCX7777220.1 hypothetical protein [Armatimonadota bacterium]MDW8024635.1 hypothetical protein [Armatimonadota bacterium]